MWNKIIEKAKKVAALDQDKILKQILDGKQLQETIVSINQKQMEAGMGADGRLLPKYTDDPFFKTYEAAIRYGRWKSHISPNKSKDINVMDFYITGKFHSTLMVENSDTYFVLASDSQISADVQAKTSNHALGLNKEGIASIIPIIKPAFIEEVRKKIA